VRDSRALRIVVAGLLLGLLVQYLFVHELVGINLLVAVAAAGGLGLLFREGGVYRADALLVGALALAAFAAVRAEALVLLFDVLASTLLLIAWAVPLRGAAPALFGGAARAYAEAAPAVRAKVRSPRPLRYATGAALALPFVVLFTSLFAAADGVFDSRLRDLLELEWLRDLGLGWRIVLGAAVAWSATGALAWMRREIPPSPARRRWLASDTAVAALVIIVGLFGMFAALQVAYLFGGRDTLEAAQMTYSSYARRGFIELVAVATVVGALLFAFGTFVERRGRDYVVVALALIGLTGIVLLSAAYRMSLYQLTYGWSELRLYASALIALLAVALVLLAAAAVTDRMRLVPGRLVIAAVAIALAVNALGPARFVATANLDRFADPSHLPPDAQRDLDVWYLAALGDGAVPVLVERLLTLPEPQRARLVDALRYPEAHRPRTSDWQSWNWDRARATEAFAAR
jgi:hypothetical protein